MSLFDLLKFLPLFVGKIDCDFLVRFRHELMDALARVAPYRRSCAAVLSTIGEAFATAQASVEAQSEGALSFDRPFVWTVSIKEKMPSIKSPKQRQRFHQRRIQG